jgi:hypothetical protein
MLFELPYILNIYGRILFLLLSLNLINLTGSAPTIYRLFVILIITFSEPLTANSELRYSST